MHFFSAILPFIFVFWESISWRSETPNVPSLANPSHDFSCLMPLNVETKELNSTLRFLSPFVSVLVYWWNHAVVKKTQNKSFIILKGMSARKVSPMSAFLLVWGEQYSTVMPHAAHINPIFLFVYVSVSVYASCCWISKTNTHIIMMITGFITGLNFTLLITTVCCQGEYN